MRPAWETEEDVGAAMEFAEDLSKILHRRAGHVGALAMCSDPECRHRYGVITRGEPYAGPTFSELVAMGEAEAPSTNAPPEP